MAATQGEPPAVARQRVRRALREARQAIGLSQGEVAKRLGWSLSKMQRIEGGEVGVSITDLRALLDVYGITDVDEVARLIADAQTSRRQRWVTSREYREHLPPALRQLMQFETEATAIRAYQPVLIPGVLQTPAVAETVLNWNSNAISEDDRRVRFEVRMQRRRQTVENSAGPEYLLILDESVIKRHIGGALVMAEQLEALAEAARRPNICVRLVPFEQSALAGLADAFQILNLSENDDDGVVYRESYDDDRILHDPAEVLYFRKVFEEILAVSLTEAATQRAIVAEAMKLRSSLDNAYRR
jgi:transcriptional regulator with XRE-family HTH domain